MTTTFTPDINDDCVETQVPNPDYIPATDGFWKTESNPEYVPATDGYYTTEPNPDYIPATDGYYTTEPNPEYVPATDGYYTTVPNPDYIPAIPEHTVPGGFMKWNWTGGPTDEVPSFPGIGWHQVGITNDSKGSTPGVVHQGSGKASYFYYEPVETVVPETPAVGTEFIDVWNEGTPAIGEETIQVWYEGTPAVGEETIQVWNEGTPAVGEETIQVWNEGTPAVGDEFLTEDCPVVEESVVPVLTDTSVKTVETKTDTVEAVVVSSTDTPLELATTGSIDPFTGGFLGLALLAAGGTLVAKSMMKRKTVTHV